MTTPEQGVWKKRFAGATALSWAALGLLWAQVIALPSPLLPPPFFAELLGEVPTTTRPDRFVVMILKGKSLLLCAFALLGLLPAALAWRAGARGSSLVTAGLCAATVAISLMPMTQAQRVASAEGVTLSLPGYFAGPDSVARVSSQTATYARPGGEELKVDVWRPPGGDPNGGPSAGEAGAAGGRPAVVVVHGGGWRSGTRGEFPEWNAWLAEKGYVVFDIDYRLSASNWQEAPSDVACAVGWAKGNAYRYGVDPGRVALMGRSAGGHLALLAAYTRGPAAPTPGCEAPGTRDTGVAAVAAFYPPTDLARLSRQGYLGGMDRFLGGDPEAVPGRYRLLSPISRVGPGDPPTFLAHGGADEIVPPEESELLRGRLHEAGVPHNLVELPWANHTFDFLWGGWGSQVTRSSLERFLEKHLETPERAKLPPFKSPEKERGGKGIVEQERELRRTPSGRSSLGPGPIASGSPVASLAIKRLFDRNRDSYRG